MLVIERPGRVISRGRRDPSVVGVEVTEEGLESVTAREKEESSFYK